MKTLIITHMLIVPTGTAKSFVALFLQLCVLDIQFAELFVRVRVRPATTNMPSSATYSARSYNLKLRLLTKTVRKIQGTLAKRPAHQTGQKAKPASPPAARAPTISFVSQ